MKLTRSVAVAGLVATSALALSACGSSSSPKTGASSTPSASAAAAGPTCATGSLNGAGSTFQQTLEQQLASAYGSACSGAMINYSGTGSGAGIASFGSGTIDFAGSDVLMSASEQATATMRCGGNVAVHIPIAAGGIAVLYNLPGVTKLNLDAATLAQIFTGKITKWNDPAIAALNSGVSLPSTAIQTAQRSDSSGTTSVFTSYLAAAAGSDWTLGSGKTIAFPVGQNKKGSDGVAAYVKATPGGITYAETSYAEEDSLSTANIKSGSAYVSPTAAAVSDAIGQATVGGTAPDDTQVTLDYTVADGKGYPISTVSYAIVCSKGTAAAKLPLLKDYLSYFVGAGQTQGESIGFAPLPANLVSADKTTIASLS